MEKGRGAKLLVILEDVSDASRLERLAAWQEVARRVAHEIKNPLTPIQISADRLQRRLLPQLKDQSKESELLEECLGQIQKQVRTIRDLVREFSDAAKLPEPQFQEIQVVAFLSRLMADYRFLHPDITFDFQASQEHASARIQADPEYLRRLVVNLADNAVHSLVQEKTLDPRFTIRVTAANQVGWIQIQFMDNGPGVSPTMADKIFDPYVTSKASGLGLGLAIVRRIAMEHGGRIVCAAGPGATFLLDLPLIWKEDSSHVQIPSDR
jgi:two-component system nitrogen regulation sensor histidine kinase NtrY